MNMDDMGLDEVFKDTDRRGRLSMVNDVSVTPLDVERCAYISLSNSIMLIL